MAVVGFKQYSNRDRYAARRAVNKTTNLVWKVIVTGIVLAVVGWIVVKLVPWQKTVNSTINGPTRYEGVPNFYK